MNTTPLATDWNNVDLNEGSYERESLLIDPLSFDTLLLELKCNCRVIDETAVLKQFETDLKSRVNEAIEICKANVSNIAKQANKERG